VLKQVEPALEKGIITKEEAEIVKRTEEARFDAITVDEFTLEEYNEGRASAPVADGLKNPDDRTVMI
jgi:acyl-CoA dehydrogenase